MKASKIIIIALVCSILIIALLVYLDVRAFNKAISKAEEISDKEVVEDLKNNVKTLSYERAKTQEK